jgi:hypothetical protein
LFAYWGVPSRVLARSTDGVTWERFGRYPDELDTVSPVFLTRTADGFVLAGSIEGTRDDDWLDTLVLWRSTDGRIWQRTAERPDGRPDSIVAVGDTVIVAGNDLDRTDATLDPLPERPWLQVSQDGGRRWDPGLAWSGEDDWCLRSLTANDGIISLDAACATPDAASTYAVRVGPSDAELMAAGCAPATLPVWNDAIRDPEPPDPAVPLRRGTREVTPAQARRQGFEVLQPTTVGTRKRQLLRSSRSALWSIYSVDPVAGGATALDVLDQDGILANEKPRTSLDIGPYTLADYGDHAAPVQVGPYTAAFWHLDPVALGVRPYGIVFSTERSDIGLYGADPLEVIDVARSMVCD